jgi:hypothetical protein
MALTPTLSNAALVASARLAIEERFEAMASAPDPLVYARADPPQLVPPAPVTPAVPVGGGQ